MYKPISSVLIVKAETDIYLSQSRKSKALEDGRRSPDITRFDLAKCCIFDCLLDDSTYFVDCTATVTAFAGLTGEILENVCQEIP